MKKKRPPSDRDVLLRRPAPPKPPRLAPASNAGLPLDADAVAPPEQQAAALRKQISDLEGTLRYMGESHPQRPAQEARLAQLKHMLGRLQQEH